MNVAALLLAVEAAPETTPTRVIQSGIVGKRYLVRVEGKGCGRGRFVEARRFHAPWRCQACKFEDRADAKALAERLDPAEGQSIKVVPWKRAWHEEVSDDRWPGTPKIAPALPDGHRPLLELVRLYAEALKGRHRLGDIIPAAFPFIQPLEALEEASLAGPGGADTDRVENELRAWRDRLTAAGVSTTRVLIVGAAKKIADLTQELGSNVIAIGAQYHGLLGGWMHRQTVQDLLCAAPCPILISQIAPKSP